MRLNFYDYDGLQPKMSAGIINEHECTYIGYLEFEIEVEKLFSINLQF